MGSDPEANAAHTWGTGDPHQAGCCRAHAPRCLKFGSEVMSGPWRVWGWLRPDSQSRGEWEVRNGDSSGRLFSSGAWLQRRAGRPTDF